MASPKACVIECLQCCRCNKKGKCSNCSCVKAGHRCTNCLPSKLTVCSNTESSGRRDLGECSSFNPTLPSFPPTSSSPNDLSPLTTPPSPPDTVELPPFRPMGAPNFKWNNLSGAECTDAICKCYDRAIRWIPNLFMVPYGKHGKSFIREMTHLFRSYYEDSALECMALKAVFLLPLLILQKPHRRSRAKDHAVAIERQLKCWLFPGSLRIYVRRLQM